jgi:DNA primase
MPFVDFAELKSRVSIEQTISILGLNLKLNGNQYRGPCPICQSGGDRALVITPSKGLFYCFAKRVGGDQIALVAHIKNVSLSEAASLLSVNSTVSVSRNSTVPTTVPPTPAVKKPGFDPEAYAARLDPSHASLVSLGISAETLRMFKAGYASSGSNRGRLALPLHDRDGNLIGFCGRSLKEESPMLAFPNGVNPHEFIFNAHRISEGELYLVRDPLDVLKAYEAGVENVVAFLTDISAQQVEMLAALMDSKKCETVALF